MCYFNPKHEHRQKTGCELVSDGDLSPKQNLGEVLDFFILGGPFFGCLAFGRWNYSH